MTTALEVHRKAIPGNEPSAKLGLDMLQDAHTRLYDEIARYFPKGSSFPNELDVAAGQQILRRIESPPGFESSGVNITFKRHENCEGSFYISKGDNEVRFRMFNGGQSYTYLNGQGNFFEFNQNGKLEVGRLNGERPKLWANAKCPRELLVATDLLESAREVLSEERRNLVEQSASSALEKRGGTLTIG